MYNLALNSFPSVRGRRLINRLSYSCEGETICVFMIQSVFLEPLILINTDVRSHKYKVSYLNFEWCYTSWLQYAWYSVVVFYLLGPLPFLFFLSQQIVFSSNYKNRNYNLMFTHAKTSVKFCYTYISFSEI
jgi:hypothetical protein